MKTRSIIASAAILIAAGLSVAGCSSQAQTVSDNLSKQADSFNVYRDITFYNGITDKYILEMQGYCSVQPASKQVAVICRVGQNAYTKNFMGLSDNVTYVAQQVKPLNVSPWYHTVIFKPQSLLPNIQTQVGW